MAGRSIGNSRGGPAIVADAPDPKAKDVVRDWERGRADLGTTLSHCQQVANYLYPDRADFLIDRSPGQKRMQYVFSAAPLYSHELGAAGLHSMLTSDTLPWFSTMPDDERLWQNPEVQAWFQAADKADYNIFNSPWRNFAPQSHEVYLDVLAFGTACMALLPSDRSDVLFSTRHLKECAFFENEEDRIDQVSRRWPWTAKQAWDKWGEGAGPSVVKEMADSTDTASFGGSSTGNPAKKFWFHHRVKPRAVRDPQRADAKHKLYESIYVNETDMLVLSEGGFDRFPYIVPRLAKNSAEVWGRGRGMMLLPDIKMLNEWMKIFYRHGQKVVAPPLMLPDDGFIVPIKTTPDSFNYYRAGTRPTDRIAPIPLGGDMKLGMDVILFLENKIKEGFFNNLMLTPTDPRDPASAGKGVTATFTDRQKAENMRALSPLNSRLNAEWSAQLVEGVRAINWARSVARRFGPGSPYPPPAEMLRQAHWHSEFKSPIALAQRASELTAIDQLMQRQLQLKQMDPSTAMIVDAEAVIRLEARDLNVPVEVLKTPERLQQE